MDQKKTTGLHSFAQPFLEAGFPATARFVHQIATELGQQEAEKNRMHFAAMESSLSFIRTLQVTPIEEDLYAMFFAAMRTRSSADMFKKDTAEALQAAGIFPSEKADVYVALYPDVARKAPELYNVLAPLALVKTLGLKDYFAQFPEIHDLETLLHDLDGENWDTDSFPQLKEAVDKLSLCADAEINPRLFFKELENSDAWRQTLGILRAIHNHPEISYSSSTLDLIPTIQAAFPFANQMNASAAEKDYYLATLALIPVLDEEFPVGDIYKGDIFPSVRQALRLDTGNLFRKTFPNKEWNKTASEESFLIASTLMLLSKHARFGNSGPPNIKQTAQEFLDNKLLQDRRFKKLAEALQAIANPPHPLQAAPNPAPKIYAITRETPLFWELHQEYGRPAQAPVDLRKDKPTQSLPIQMALKKNPFPLTGIAVVAIGEHDSRPSRGYPIDKGIFHTVFQTFLDKAAENVAALTLSPEQKDLTLLMIVISNTASCLPQDFRFEDLYAPENMDRLRNSFGLPKDFPNATQRKQTSKALANAKAVSLLTLAEMYPDDFMHPLNNKELLAGYKRLAKCSDQTTFAPLKSKISDVLDAIDYQLAWEGVKVPQKKPPQGAKIALVA